MEIVHFLGEMNLNWAFSDPNRTLKWVRSLLQIFSLEPAGTWFNGPSIIHFGVCLAYSLGLEKIPHSPLVTGETHNREGFVGNSSIFGNVSARKQINAVNGKKILS